MISIVIPCYNEAQNIPLIVHRLREVLADRDDVEVILVDNGSSDDSAALLKAQLAGDRALRSITVPVNQGYGHGILQGLAAAIGDVLAWTHADMQTDPKDVLTAYDLYCRQEAGGPRIVKGKRRNRAPLETLFTFGMQVIASLALRIHLDDVNAQPKVFSRAFYDRFLKHGAPADFSLDLYLLYAARRSGMVILEVPVHFAKRLHGEAKGGGNWRTRIKLIRRTFTYIFQLRRNLPRQANLKQ